jgi:hypothetical protein
MICQKKKYTTWPSFAAVSFSMMDDVTTDFPIPGRPLTRSNPTSEDVYHRTYSSLFSSHSPVSWWWASRCFPYSEDSPTYFVGFSHASMAVKLWNLS